MDVEKQVTRKHIEPSKPVTINDIIEVTIENLNGLGEGITRKDDFIIYVKNSKKGEKCKIKIIDIKRTYAVGEKLK